MASEALFSRWKRKSPRKKRVCQAGWVSPIILLMSWFDMLQLPYHLHKNQQASCLYFLLKMANFFLNGICVFSPNNYLLKKTNKNNHIYILTTQMRVTHSASPPHDQRCASRLLAPIETYGTWKNPLYFFYDYIFCASRCFLCLSYPDLCMRFWIVHAFVFR